MSSQFLKLLMMSYVVLQLSVVPTSAQPDGEPGVSGGSSPGSEGMPDNDATYLAKMRKSLKMGKTSRAYIASLLDLGMHYNRANRFPEAAKVLRQALSIIDGGALKPTPDAQRKPEQIIEKHQDNGVVSAEVVRTPMPYEEMLQELLPQLITAELGANEFNVVEAHIKRLLALKGPNGVADKLAQMSAYASYAELMRKRNRPKEAQFYQKKMEEINASFKPL